jgi:hypothetical protein
MKNVYYPIDKNLLVDCVMSQINPLRILTTHFFKTLRLPEPVLISGLPFSVSDYSPTSHVRNSRDKSKGARFSE